MEFTLTLTGTIPLILIDQALGYDLLVRSDILNQHIQQLRGVAILLVILSHIPAFPWIFKALGEMAVGTKHGDFFLWIYNNFFGVFGVHLFFVISGAVITGILLKTQKSLDAELNQVGQGLLHFYQRRFLRLFPTAFIWLVIPGVVFILLGHISLGRFFTNFFHVFGMTFNSFFDSHPGDGGFFMGPYWSLVVEVQFYFIFPLFFFFFPRRLLIPFLLIATVGLVFSGKMGMSLKSAAACFPFLFAGSILAHLFWDKKINFDRTFVKWFRFVYFPLLLLFLAFGHIAVSKAGSMGMLGVLLACAILVALAVTGSNLGFFDRTFLGKTLVWVGDRSYSLYLCHLPVYNLVMQVPVFGSYPITGAGVALGASLVVSYFSHRYIEVPFRSLGLEKSRSTNQVPAVL